jgi:hypothetical protein
LARGLAALMCLRCRKAAFEPEAMFRENFKLYESGADADVYEVAPTISI